MGVLGALHDRKRRRAGWVTAAMTVALVVAVAPAQPAGATSIDCQVDPATTIPTTHPAARYFADVVDNGGCEFVWDFVVDRLVDGRYTPPSTIQVHWPRDGVGGAIGGHIYIGYQHLQTIYDQFGSHDWGLLYHEFAHHAQNYPAAANAQWVTESLADWVRYQSGHVPLGVPPGTPICQGGHYTEGYRCGGAFLGWIDTTYAGGDRSFVGMLNAGYHFASPNPPTTNIEILTGRTVDQLWAECRQSACAGGLA